VGNFGSTSTSAYIDFIYRVVAPKRLAAELDAHEPR
jgi:hypothetical protein